jgi:hypothetical protein
MTERRPAEDRFAEKYEVVDGCWLWTACLSSSGYGRFNYGGRGTTGQAHRWAYEHYIGQIPDGMQLDHLCRNPRCVNPNHLEPVSPGENQRRGLLGVLKTHCPQGHEWTPSNTRTRLSGKDKGGRYCAGCSRERYRDWYYAQKEKA